MKQVRVWQLVMAFVLTAGCGASEPELDEPAIDEVDPGEPRTGDFVFYEGEAPVELDYRWVDDKMVLEEDVVLDPQDEVTSAEGKQSQALLAVRYNSRLWPGGVIPYRISSSVTTPRRVRAAMKVWSDSTPIRFVPRTNQAAYVLIREEDGNRVCRSQVGYTGGRRTVYLRDTSVTSSCNLGVIVHELGHIIGFWHEHTRDDRDQYVKILWNNVADPAAFTKKTYGVRKVGRYDINSSMHYRSFTYSRPSNRPSIERRDGSLILHNWATLSAKDIAATKSLY